MLSNTDLKKELGKHIGIYPFVEKNIEGASIYFTASKYAWLLESRQYVVNADKIKIGANDAVIIFTEETITLDKYFAGMCYTRVSHTVKGLSSSSTPIKPGWTGRLIIVLHNNGKKDVEIKVGDTIAVIMLEKLKKAATFSDEKGGGGRFDLLASMEIQLTDEMREELNQRHFVNRDDLLKKMKEEEEFKSFVRDKSCDKWTVLMGISVLLMVIELAVLCFEYAETQQINGIVAILLAPTCSFFVTLLSKRIN